MSNDAYDSLAGYCKSLAGSGQAEAQQCTCYYTMEYAQNLLKDFDDATAKNMDTYTKAHARWDTASKTQKKTLYDYWMGCRIKEDCTKKDKCCKSVAPNKAYTKCSTYGSWCDPAGQDIWKHNCGMSDDAAKKYADHDYQGWLEKYKEPTKPADQDPPSLQIACCQQTISGEYNDYSDILQKCSAQICNDGDCTGTGGGDDDGDTNVVYCTKDTTCEGYANRCSSSTNTCKRKPFLVWGLVLLSLSLIIFLSLFLTALIKWNDLKFKNKVNMKKPAKK